MFIIGTLMTMVASILFTNAIEHVGDLMNWSESFTGAIIAPLFTSIPELTIVLVAIFVHGGATGQEIGIGTIFGQPFMTSSLSYALVLLAMIFGYKVGKRKDLRISVDRRLAIPFIFTVVFFPIVLVPGILHGFLVDIFFSLLFLGGYFYYAWLMYRSRVAEIELEAELETGGEEALYLGRFLEEKPAYLVQLILAVIGLYYGSEMLVKSIDIISRILNVSPLGAALILAPAATAIPETMTAIIWGYHGKDTFAIASLVGERILYSTFYPALGILITDWILDIYAYFSVLVTTLVSLVMIPYIRRGRIPSVILALGFVFFVLYAAFVFLHSIFF